MVTVTFRTVVGETFKMDVGEELTVGELKGRVSSERSVPTDGLKLVYK
jgi:hypothetical protein